MRPTVLIQEITADAAPQCELQDSTSFSSLSRRLLVWACVDGCASMDVASQSWPPVSVLDFRGGRFGGIGLGVSDSRPVGDAVTELVIRGWMRNGLAG